MQRPLSLALLLLACNMAIGARNVSAASSEPTQLAQAQPAQPPTTAPDPATPDAAAPAADAQAPEEPVGNVATVTGNALLALAAINSAVTLLGAVQGKVGTGQNTLAYAVNLAT